MDGISHIVIRSIAEALFIAASVWESLEYCASEDLVRRGMACRHHVIIGYSTFIVD